jgi:hypothetical protein
MVLIIILPLEHETLLVVGIVRPSVKPVVRSRSIDPNSRNGSSPRVLSFV